MAAHRGIFKLLLGMVAVSMVVLALSAATARATAVGSTCTVTNTYDSGSGSLRDCINQANAANTHGRHPPFAITFVGFSGANILYLSTPLPVVIGNTTITQPGAAVMSIDGSSPMQSYPITITPERLWTSPAWPSPRHM